MIILQDELKSEILILSPDGSEEEYKPGQSSDEDSEDEYESLETSNRKRKKVQSKTQKRRGRGDAAYRRSLMQRSGLSRSQTQSSASTTAQSASYRLKRHIGRPRGSVRTKRIPRPELLSQHEIIVDELREEDIARGSESNFPRETLKVEENSSLNEGKFTNKY